jgi:hypothetical protein
MFINSVRQFVIGICIVCGASSASAAPITYTFGGTLNQPYDGSTQLSGTFTYDPATQVNGNTTPPTNGTNGYMGIPAYPVILNFNVGGAPTWTNFGTVVLSSVMITHTQTNDQFILNETFSNEPGQNLGAEIVLSNNNTVQPGPFSSTALPSSLNLASFNLGAQFTLQGSNGQFQNLDVTGTITSLTPLASGGGGGGGNVPEPSSVLVFLALAGGLAVRLRASRRVLSEAPM